MFGSKNNTNGNKTPSDEGRIQTHEYFTIACFGIVAFNKESNESTKKGWELINGCMAGTVHYGYFRRSIVTASPE